MKLPPPRDPTQARRMEYPSEGDGLDAIAKQFQLMREAGVPIHPDTAAWLDRRLAIKTKFPRNNK